MKCKFLLEVTIAAGLLMAGCQKEAAVVRNDDYEEFAACDSWEQWLERAMQSEYERLTDLSTPGRYPWCEAMDSYYQANNLWYYSDTDWRQMYRGGDEVDNVMLAGSGPEETYWLANPEWWRDGSGR